MVFGESGIPEANFVEPSDQGVGLKQQHPSTKVIGAFFLSRSILVFGLTSELKPKKFGISSFRTQHSPKRPIHFRDPNIESNVL